MYNQNQKGNALLGGFIGLAVLAFIGWLFFFFPWWPTIISDKEEGVVTTLGDIKEETTGTGVYWRSLFITRIDRIDMRERTHTISTETVSKEGLKFGVDITVRYEVKDEAAINLVTNLQTPLHELVLTYANATIDDVATSKDKNAMYSDEGRVAIVQAVKDKLNTELGAYAQINQVVFEDIRLPASITQAIEAQQAELEKVKRTENQKAVAENEAEIRRIEAQGIADSNRIIQSSLTREYLQYEAIQKFNPDAEKIYIPSDAMTPVISY
jgi:regulator of protease activity HflC (stomatin/prohibitin superfamily)